MTIFSRDIDLLKLEPTMFNEPVFPSQTLAKGANGILDGTTFTAAGEDFIAKSVQPGGVIFLQTLDGAINAAYEIVSVDSPTQLTVSIVRTSRDNSPIHVAYALGVIYRVSTFAPQAADAIDEITGWFGIRPGLSDSPYTVDDIIDPVPMRLLSAYRVLIAVFAALAGSEKEKITYTQKRDYYTTLYKNARSRAKIKLRITPDKLTGYIIEGGVIRCVRE